MRLKVLILVLLICTSIVYGQGDVYNLRDSTAIEGPLNVIGDVSYSGHKDSQEFLVNAFQYPAPGTDWTPARTGAGLVANRATKYVWLSLNFLKIGDEIVSYKLVGDAVEAAALTLDCSLYKISKTDPTSTSVPTGGSITQITADGNFDSEAVLSSPEVVATDRQYCLEIKGTTGAGDSFIVYGAEVKVNRK